VIMARALPCVNNVLIYLLLHARQSAGHFSGQARAFLQPVQTLPRVEELVAAAPVERHRRCARAMGRRTRVRKREQGED
jgi:hypothetical protein